MASINSQKRIHSAAIRLFAETGAQKVSIRDLAGEAGVARGTVYAYLDQSPDLFERTAERLAHELHLRVAKGATNIDDPAHKVALGIYHFIYQAQLNPDWGRFLCQFGFSANQLVQLWHAQPMHDVKLGIKSGRFDLQESQIRSAVTMLACTVIGAIQVILSGHKGWREACAEVTELILKSFGLDASEARDIAADRVNPASLPS
ncbi:MAG: TetR/AcrR family transcriptional regulator [Halieaceae bacterium]|nr:TetR/AcrR family transcriptional regulator [Halieaceae bacterium]